MRETYAYALDRVMYGLHLETERFVQALDFMVARMDSHFFTSERKNPYLESLPRHPDFVVIQTAGTFGKGTK